MKSTAVITREDEDEDPVSRKSRVLRLARSRRPVESFADRPVPPDAIQALLECARHAHSASEAQPWRFVAVQQAMTVHRLAEAAFNDPRLRSAPLVIVACARVHSHVSGTGRPSYPVDLAAATQSMVLAAEEMGLGTCWITGYRESDVRDALDVPRDVPVVAMLAVGYAEELRERPEREPVENVVAWEEWDRESR